ncbi:AzlC family ABC transporter permease [Pseudomonas chlororaphis]|uniref:AzlC family ABC transporter permease n=1 Tax=Pseudomonas chlororaphis TaxID=587753 RepID=UPI0015DE88F7|nr:AzlC family ABC transporter permease [Pseudomonas chlororaphis]QLL11841.1 AzlC family ABC transporter permease [Pseudomonas chlororaphis subsp. aurantiaca]
MRINIHARRGIIDSIPVAVSFFFVFASLGALYQEKGIQLLDAALGTALIFAAPLQVTGVDVVSNGQIVAALALTVLVNFRFLFMSMVASQYFVGVAKAKVLFSMLMFSASTYAVTHYHLKSSGVRNGASQFRYYLGVSVPSYLVAITATIFGFLLSSRVDYASIEMFMVMILPLHFTALTAKNSGQGFTVLATLIGGLCAPLLIELDSVWLMVGLPVVVGYFLAVRDISSNRRGVS